MERKYVAFISYRHAELDSAVAKQLHTLIERYVIPQKLRKDGKKKLGIVFRDQEELPVSSDLSDDICRALDNAQYLIVVCTKNTAQSPWVGREISYFLSHHDRGCAFAALADGEPSEVFPLALTQIHNPDGTITDVEPLAIDLRADSIPAMRKKAKREILRLFAALIGCPYDALVMRQQRRKRRQLASIMAVILAVVTGFSAMTLVKNHQIDQKNQELAGMNQTLEDKNVELEEKNDELARQKAEVQLRESELLTEKALSYLAEDDTQNAMENALAALPSDTDERPYYALAEQALTSCLGIYDDSRSNYEIFSTVLEQKTPIACYEISPDGTKIMTMDDYGLVTCFDVAAGETLWTSQVSDSTYADNMQMLPSADGKSVIVSIDVNIAAVEWESGNLLWENTLGSDSRIFLSPDGKILGYRSQVMQSNVTYYDYAYEFISAETGEKLRRIEIGTTAVWANNEEGLSTWTFPDFLTFENENGAFSSDGKYFVTSYMEKWESTGKKEQCYLLMDLEEGTCRELYRRKVEEDYSLEKTRFLYFTADDSAVVSVLDPNTNTAYRVEKIDVQTGKRLWLSDTGAEENVYFWSGDPMQAQMGINSLFLSRSGCFYALDIHTGEHVHTMTADEREIVSLEWVESPFFSIIFSDGSYTLGWANDSGVYTSDYYYGPYLDIGTSVGAKLWNNGIVRMIVEDGYIQGTHVGTAEDPNGYIVSVPEEESHTLEIKQAVNFGELIPKETVELVPEEGYLLNSAVQRAGKDHFVLGRYSLETDGQTQYSYRSVDLQTHQVEEIVFDDFLMEEYIYFTSDGSSYVATDYTQGMILHQKGQEDTVLMENPQVPNLEDPSQMHYKYSFDACVQTADKRLLSAALGDGVLTYWFDGQEKTEVAVPAAYMTEKLALSGTRRFLTVGYNGIVLMGDYAEGEDHLIQAFVAYDTGNGKWYRFAEGRDTSNGYASVARENPWLMINDASNNVYIYDMPTNTLLYQFPLQLPLNSVDQIGLAVGDQYLVVKTIDLQVYLYELTTGQIVFSQQMEGYSGGHLVVREDAVNNRLYIWEDSTYRYAGYCVDMGSWTVLAEVDGLVYYDPDRNQVYCYRSSLSGVGECFIVFSPPSLEELVKLGETVTGK